MYTSLDVQIEEFSLQQSRQRHDDSRVLEAANFRFDIFPDKLVQLLWQ